MLTTLPLELAPKILCYLPFHSHLRLRQTSRTFHTIVHTESPLFRFSHPSFASLLDALPTISASILAPGTFPSVSDGPVCYYVSVPHRASVVVKVQSFESYRPVPLTFNPGPPTASKLKPPLLPPRGRISVRAKGVIRLPLARGLALVAEGIGAPGGDCSTVVILRGSMASGGGGGGATQQFAGAGSGGGWGGSGSAAPAYPGDILHTVYSVADWGGEPAIRGVLAKDRSSSHLRAFLDRGAWVELRYRGIGSDVFHYERYRIEKAMDGNGVAGDVMVVTTENVERVDTREVIIPREMADNNLAQSEGQDRGAGCLQADASSPLLSWIVDLWRNMEDGDPTPHSNLTAKKFRRQGTLLVQ